LFLRVATVLGGPGPVIVDASRSHSVKHTALDRESDKSEAETSNWQHTTITRDRHRWPRRYSNPHFQHVSNHRPTP